MTGYSQPVNLVITIYDLGAFYLAWSSLTDITEGILIDLNLTKIFQVRFASTIHFAATK